MLGPDEGWVKGNSLGSADGKADGNGVGTSVVQPAAGLAMLQRHAFET